MYRAVKCRLIWHIRGQALLLRVQHVVACECVCDNVRDCIFLKDDLNRLKKGLISYELNFSRVAPNFGFGFGKSEIRPFFPNSAKFGFGQISGRI